jgi:hypothetical protein
MGREENILRGFVNRALRRIFGQRTGKSNRRKEIPAPRKLNVEGSVRM